MRLVFLLFTILFTSCALDDGKPLGVLFEYDQEHEGMIRIKSEGNRVVLGTSESTAKFSESPKMNVDFTYSFSISKNEVTRNEYAEFMGGESSSIQDSGDLPQTNVTYYDAVLYANARSVSEGYDTAYTYSSVIYDAKGNCTYLDSLLFNPSKEAYRLPTEAEWVFAASHNWRPNQGWNNLNSDYRVHKVCTADINALSICDMAGNAMEWVNDHLGNFKDTTLINYIGASKENSFKERIVKGGSYHKSPSQAQLYSRGDVYTVTSSTKAEYVGFRLVFGRIPDPLYFDSKNEISNQFNIVASLSSIKEMTESNHLKMAFVNKDSSSLVYADFSKMGLSLYEIKDNLKVNHPDISPDGNYVAFCTGLEGVSGSSQVYVRDLNPSGSNLVRLNVESAAIPRFRVLPSGDTVIVYVSDAGNNKEESEWKQKSTWQVPFKNGKFGTPEKLFDGSYHGGFSEDGSLAVTGARLLRANVNGKDSIWYNGEQACNVSLSKDNKKQTLFLDFVGKTGKDFAGKSYAVHEYLWLADSTGKIDKYIAAPKGKTWDHTEWSSIEDVAVASVVNQLGMEESIYMINTNNSSILKLIEGSDMSHPSLWIEKTDFSYFANELNFDSAGFYYAEGNPPHFEVMQAKMEMFWKMKDSIDFVIWGSSRAKDGIIPDALSSVKAINMGHTGNRLYSSVFFLENYAFNHVSNLKGVAIGIDIDIWDGYDDHHEAYFSASKGYAYDQNHNFWVDSLPSSFLKWLDYINPVSNEMYTTYMIYKGYYYIPPKSLSQEGEAFVYQDSLWNHAPPDIIDRNLDALESFLKNAEKRNIYVVGVIAPQVSGFKKTGAYGRYGPRRSVAIAAIEKMKELEEKYPDFHLLDEYKMNENDYSYDMFYNDDHLNNIGAALLTSRLDSLLKILD
jgi:uncharacterized protein (TIGR02171 family)